MVGSWAGPPAMMNIFHKMFGSHSCPAIIQQNSFSNFQHYFIQKVGPFLSVTGSQVYVYASIGRLAALSVYMPAPQCSMLQVARPMCNYWSQGCRLGLPSTTRLAGWCGGKKNANFLSVTPKLFAPKVISGAPWCFGNSCSSHSQVINKQTYTHTHTHVLPYVVRRSMHSILAACMSVHLCVISQRGRCIMELL